MTVDAEKEYLVSVIVITYNSERFVLDTLESVKRQTYKHIELIISDDCSKDDTCKICRQWLDENQNCFVRSELIATENNGGICANYNNALSHATGKWIKYIAGDDILEDNCIAIFADATSISDDKIFISGVTPFNEKDDIMPRRMSPGNDWHSLSVNEQEKRLVKQGTIIEGPTLFLHRETLIANGGFETIYPMIEDYPLVMKYLSRGHHIGLVSAYPVRYREYGESVSRSGNDRFGQSIFAAIDFYAPKAAWRNGMYAYWWHYTINKWLRGKYNNEWYKRPFVYLLRATDIISWRKKR